MDRAVEPEPVTPDPPRPVRAPVMRQVWRDAVFLHWETDRDAARRLLPPGTVLDRFEGRTFVGVVGLRMEVAPLGVRVPGIGSFAEVNVRLYSVDERGRRGVVFVSMDAGRVLPALSGRLGYRLPYAWSDVTMSRTGPTVSYAVRRRAPAAGRPPSSFSVEIGEQLAEPSALEHFVTARWTLHWRWYGRTVRCAVSHPPWPLFAAELVSFDSRLVVAAGLPAPAGEPVSVLWSPGVPAGIGPPRPSGR